MKKKSFIYFSIKRLFDIFSTFFMITLISWFLFIIFIINLIVTKGKPIYVDHRVGKNGKTINLLKFRSMYGDAQTNPEKYFNEEQMKQWKTERKVPNDPRLTGFGKFMRKTSIDELPQLFNIFIGQMSVVGPRPVVQKEIDDNYTEEQRKILLSARPGLISYWGVNGRNTVSYDDGRRQQLELEYFNKRGLFFDLGLIFKAIFVVISCKGAK